MRVSNLQRKRYSDCGQKVIRQVVLHVQRDREKVVYHLNYKHTSPKVKIWLKSVKTLNASYSLEMIMVSHQLSQVWLLSSPVSSTMYVVIKDDKKSRARSSSADRRISI